MSMTQARRRLASLSMIGWLSLGATAHAGETRYAPGVSDSEIL
jgi:hypothetical protein